MACTQICLRAELGDHDPLWEARARIERLEAARKEVYDWMREPDYVENASLQWLTEWVNRRPIRAALAVER